MWRLLHEAPERMRKMHRELALQRGRCIERECTVRWFVEVEGRNMRWMGEDWREKCKYMTKKQWTGEVTAEAAVEYAAYWTDRIRSKAMEPVVQAAAPQEYVGKCVHKPGNHFATGADTDDRLYSGVIAAYNRARGEWAVKYDPGAPAYGEQYGHEDMREYGPKEYALDTHTNERRNNKVEYLQRRGSGVAWFLRGHMRVPPAVVRWHAQAVTDSGLADKHGCVGGRGMCACGAAQATAEHVYLRCAMHVKNRPALLEAIGKWQDMVEHAGMRRPRVEEALVWVHWHQEGLNMMVNMAKGGPGGAVGLHHMMSTRKTGEDMRWAAYAFWKAAEANREVRNGARSRAAGGSQVVAAQAAPILCATQPASALSLAWTYGVGTAVP